ncbi:hypothetical protein Cgig2_006459 [Carnegiea gigantea]|uniref:Uncharacterized protein n=1 Tax=Carnegiea gigantea TaxID=171969 RepID=A0A9Q1JRR2_9CARY|nr:hypothetical protein Cgig2_006459 [Carnegiea gigantea]
MRLQEVARYARKRPPALHRWPIYAMVVVVLPIDLKMIVKAWALDLVLDKKNVQKLPIWSASSLSKLSSVLRKPIKVDKGTQDKDKIVYAHILVEVQIEDIISVTIEFVKEKEIAMQQALTFTINGNHLSALIASFLGNKKILERRRRSFGDLPRKIIPLNRKTSICNLWLVKHNLLLVKD